ncbi:TNF receptor-associated factor 1 [Rhinophrynus dorsalis]
MAKLKMMGEESPCSAPDENEFLFGYPASICDNVPGNKYLCCNCNNVLKKAQQTLCGHRYCSPCLSWLVRNFKRPYCQKCKEEDPVSVDEDSLLMEDRAFSDAAINKEISELKVHCVTVGCSWTGILKDYDDHQSLCDHAPIRCHTGCGQSIIRKQLAEHLENECANNTTTCPKCSQRISSNEFLAQNFGSASRKEKCRYSQVGCSYLGNREENIKEHEKSSAANHLSMLLPLLLKIKSSLSGIEVTENGVSEALQKSFLALQFKELKVGNGEAHVDYRPTLAHAQEKSTQLNLTNRLTALEARVQVFENIIAVLNKEIDNLNAEFAVIQEQKAEAQRKVKALEQKTEHLRCLLAMKDDALNELQIRLTSHEQTTYDGIFLWKIPELTQKCQDAMTGRAISLYSSAFYTAKYGYKVCLRIYLNGDGAGKGTHVSLFFTIMKGEYDALLSWPFKHKVTFMLVDQSNREHVLDAFRPDITSASFQRPVNDMNVASGCPLFCPFSKLHSPKHTFIRDDTLFIRCIIETSS